MKTKATIVIPTIREAHIKEFLKQWEPQFRTKEVRVIVVVDHPTKHFSLPHWVDYYTHEDIDAELDDDAWIISRKSSSIRNYGTLKAVQEDTEMIWHLDDDCFPISGDELDRHYNNLNGNESIDVWESTDEDGQHVRGMPYKNRNKTIELVVSHGTWTHNPDYDAPHQLANRFNFSPKNCVIDPGAYFSMCGMNIAFKPEVAAAMYFALNGPSQPYDRIDDIWMGIIAKRVLDHMRLYCYTGYPQIRHDRASDPFKNMIAEAPGMLPNETFWQYIDNINIHTNQPTLHAAVRHVARYMDRYPFMDLSYFRDYGQALGIWAEWIDAYA